MRRRFHSIAAICGTVALMACSGPQPAEDSAAESVPEIEDIPDFSTMSVSDPACPMLNQMRAWPAPAATGGIDPVSNRIALSSDEQIAWNGEPIAFETLRQYLEITATMQPQPQLNVGIASADNCERVRLLVNMIEEVIDCSGRSCVLDYAAGD